MSLAVIRQFLIEPSKALRAMWPERYYIEGYGHEVVAVRHDPDTKNTEFLIINRHKEFEWISSDDCIMHKLCDI